MDYGVDSSARRPGTRARPDQRASKSVAHLLATAVGIAQTRLELLSTELQEEVHRVAEIMLWATLALFAAGLGLILFGS